MFTGRKGGVPELFLALLCGWAAWHHTPAGGLLQALCARLWGGPDHAWPLLAYDGSPSPSPSSPRAGLPGDDAGRYEAFGLALHAALQTHGLPARAGARDLEALLHPVTGPSASAAHLQAKAASLGGVDGAVLALFAGEAAARFAHDRALAAGDRPELDALARALPPGYGHAVDRSREVLALGLAAGLRWPVSEGTRVSSPFGWRTHPTLGTRRFHTGVDLAVPVGSEVRAAASGVVRRASEDAVNGKVLVIDHGRGVTTAYCHNDALAVRVGDRVHEGQVVARSGNTGRSTGPHLHYQMELRGQPVDPLAVRRRAMSPPALTRSDAP